MSLLHEKAPIILLCLAIDAAGAGCRKAHTAPPAAVAAPVGSPAKRGLGALLDLLAEKRARVAESQTPATDPKQIDRIDRLTADLREHGPQWVQSHPALIRATVQHNLIDPDEISLSFVAVGPTDGLDHLEISDEHHQLIASAKQLFWQYGVEGQHVGLTEISGQIEISNTRETTRPSGIPIPGLKRATIIQSVLDVPPGWRQMKLFASLAFANGAKTDPIPVYVIPR